MVLERLREVRRSERHRDRGQPFGVAHARGREVDERVADDIKRLPHRRADHLVGQALGLRVERHEPTRVQRLRNVKLEVGTGELEGATGRQLRAPADQDWVALPKPTQQIRLIEPRRLGVPRVVPDRGLRHRQAPTCGRLPIHRDHRHQDVRDLPRNEFGDGRDAPAIDVAPR